MNEKEVIYEVPVGQYTADQADSVLEYEFEVDGEEFYHLTIYDGPGNGFSGTIAVYGNGGVISMDNMLVQEPGFSRVSGTEVKHGFYVGNNPDQIVTLRLKFDYYPNEVAYELRNVDGNITMGLAWFETFQSGTKNQVVKIPVYGPKRGDQKYEFQIWDAGGERAIQFDVLIYVLTCHLKIFIHILFCRGWHMLYIWSRQIPTLSRPNNRSSCTDIRRRLRTDRNI